MPEIFLLIKEPFFSVHWKFTAQSMEEAVFFGACALVAQFNISALILNSPPPHIECAASRRFARTLGDRETSGMLTSCVTLTPHHSSRLSEDCGCEQRNAVETKVHSDIWEAYMRWWILTISFGLLLTHSHTLILKTQWRSRSVSA